MYSNQIYAALKLDKVTNKYFGGVHSCDKVNQVKIKENESVCIVVNTATSEDAGVHWILLFKPRNGEKMIFFDSFGKSPSDYGNCLREATIYFSTHTSFSGKYARSTKVLQSDEAAVCGIYCIFAAYQLCRNKTINTIENMFSNNRIENDRKICKWFKKYFHGKIINCRKGQHCICSKLWNK